jgi:hypothetical protein
LLIIHCGITAGGGGKLVVDGLLVINVIKKNLGYESGNNHWCE